MEGSRMEGSRREGSRMDKAEGSRMERIEGSRREGSRKDTTSIRIDGSHYKAKEDFHDYSIRKIGSSRKSVI
jgi:hypothetical protein